MKKTTALLFASVMLMAGSLISQARAAETLWDLKFKDLAGKPLVEVPYAKGCTGPQKVTIDSANTLTGAASVGSLKDALLYTKGSKSNYLPSFTLQADSGLTSGVVTVSFDLTFDNLTLSGNRPVETLLAIPFLNGQGAPAFILVVGCRGGDELFLGGSGLVKGKQQLDFKRGEVAHIKAVLDLGKHTFQFFLNALPYGDAEQDDAKFSSFQGLTVRDGTALGGNTGTTFTAGLSNFTVTQE